jgi:glycosyl hydrolase family 42 (putative beta-galactosidase)
MFDRSRGLVQRLLWIVTLGAGIFGGHAWVVGARPFSARLDPNRQLFPDSCLSDMSYLLDAPAGRHGFLTTRPNGHFYWGDGTRARFWGINVASRSLRQAPEEIDRVAGVLARAGVNMVRLEAIDNARCLLRDSTPTSTEFDAEYQDRLFYWIYVLKQHGIAVYLNLLDYRAFKEGDGVVNAAQLGRAAKPYAIFDPRLIELQKEYARRLLTTPNPYTHLPAAKDPAVALVELVNEHGLFASGPKWQSLAAPYGAQLQARWNAWLKERYGTTDALGAAWRGEGQPALQSGESLEQGSVQLPDMTAFPVGASPTPPARSEPRLYDGARFASDLQRAYFHDMKAYLRGLGLRVPITAVVSARIAADVRSAADELDFTAENFYWDHPDFEPGHPWQQPYYHTNQNPLRYCGTNSLMTFTSLLRWRGKPVVIREWNAVWPNRYRSSLYLTAATYAAFQDIDGMLCFDYGLEAPANRVGDFAIQADPSRWGLFATGASIFHRRLVAPARRLVEVSYTPADLFTPGSCLTDLYPLSWLTRVRNVRVEEAGASQADLTIAAGRADARQYDGPNSLRFTEHPGSWLPPEEHRPAPTDSPPMLDAAGDHWRFGGLGCSQEEVAAGRARGYDVAELRREGLEPVGVDSTGQVAFGYRDRSSNRVQLGHASSLQAARVALDLLAEAGASDLSHRAFDTNQLVSDTGELRRDCQNGLLAVDAPRCQALAGEFPRSQPARLGQVTLSTATESGVLVWLSLDAKPLCRSGSSLLKMVSVARNTGEDLRAAKGHFAGRFFLLNLGDSPVVTDGTGTGEPTSVSLRGREAVRAYLQNGTWELLVEAERRVLYCDTPDVDFWVAGTQYAQAVETEVRSQGSGVSPDAPAAEKLVSIPVQDSRFRYPPGARMVVLH